MGQPASGQNARSTRHAHSERTLQSSLRRSQDRTTIAAINCPTFSSPAGTHLQTAAPSPSTLSGHGFACSGRFTQTDSRCGSGQCLTLFCFRPASENTAWNYRHDRKYPRVSWFLDFIFFSLTYTFHTFYAEQVCVSTKKKKASSEGRKDPGESCVGSTRPHSWLRGSGSPISPWLGQRCQNPRQSCRPGPDLSRATSGVLTKPTERHGGLSLRWTQQLKGVSKINPLTGHSVGTDRRFSYAFKSYLKRQPPNER